MKTLMLVFVTSFAYLACNKVNNDVVRDIGIDILVVDNEGNDLLDPMKSNYLDISRSKIYYLIDGKKIEQYDPNLDCPSKFCLTLEDAAAMQNKFDNCLYREVVPAIHRDCGGDGGLIWTAGASIGAFNALASVCRHPDVFGRAICMSGTYNMNRFLEGRINQDYPDSSPLDFVPGLSGKHLDLLKQRHVLLAHGQGAYEDPDQSWKVERVLGPKGIPNRVDAWDNTWRHDWVTWRKMLPQFLGEFLPGKPAAG